VEGGSANAYDYSNGDPVNGRDLDGRCGFFGNPFKRCADPYGLRQYCGGLGCIYYQTNKSNHTVQWGIYLHDLSTGFGHWVVSVYKNGVRVDGADQYYPPHGYIPDARPGDIIHIDAEFVYYDEGQTKVSHNVPNEYTVPK
jgi:hypothetical protein